MENSLFYATTDEAYIYKILTEVLQNCLTDVCFSLSPKGIRLIALDNKTPATIEIDLFLDKEKFEEYKCENTFVISVNLQHKYRMLKNIKKKDVITFIIPPNCDNFGILTRQNDNSQPIVSWIKIQKIQIYEYDVPTGYDHPIIVQSATFQKTCKEMNNIGKTLKICRTKGSITFSSELEGMFMRSSTLGKTLQEDSSVDEEEYSDTYVTKTVTQFIKVSGLNQKMRIYTDTGKQKNLPLRLSVDVGNLGTLDIYIKSKTMLEN